MGNFFENTFLGRRLLPLRVIIDEKGTFFLWFLFTVIAGLIGPIINLVNRCALGKTSFLNSIKMDSENGTFYTFSIVLIASSIGLLFIKLINEKEVFKNVKLYFIAVCIFPMFFAGIFYSGASLRQNPQDTSKIIKTQQIKKQTKTTSLDKMKMQEKKASTPYQLIFVILAILIAIYSFCLEYMSVHPEKYDALRDDYNAKASDRIKTLEKSSEEKQNKTNLEDILYE